MAQTPHEVVGGLGRRQRQQHNLQRTDYVTRVEDPNHLLRRQFETDLYSKSESEADEQSGPYDGVVWTDDRHVGSVSRHVSPSPVNLDEGNRNENQTFYDFLMIWDKVHAFFAADGLCGNINAPKHPLKIAIPLHGG